MAETTTKPLAMVVLITIYQGATCPDNKDGAGVVYIYHGGAYPLIDQGLLISHLRPLDLDDQPCIAAPTQTICGGTLSGQLRGFGSYFSTSLDLDDNGYKYVFFCHQGHDEINKVKLYFRIPNQFLYLVRLSFSRQQENMKKNEMIFPPETLQLVVQALAMLLSSGLLLQARCNAGAAFIIKSF